MAEAPVVWYGATPIQHRGPELVPDEHAVVAAPPLSSKQKRELGWLAAAGVASAVFFLVPLVNGNQPQPLAASAVFAQISFAPAAPIPAVPTAPAGVARPRPRPRMLESREVRSLMTSAQPAVIPTDVTDATAALKRTSNPVARAILGDGRYRVQPFPRVDNQN